MQASAWEEVWRWAEAAPALCSLTFDTWTDQPVPGGLMAGGRGREGSPCTAVLRAGCKLPHVLRQGRQGRAWGGSRRWRACLVLHTLPARPPAPQARCGCSAAGPPLR